MTKSPLFGRRIHIAGSISEDLVVAPTDDVRKSRALVEGLVRELLSRGAVFVIPVDAEKLRADQMPICFDWLTWRTIADNLHLRPGDAPNPVAIGVEHHKTQEQIPEDYADLWDRFRGSDLVQIENAAHWNMASKRMETQARWGDILIALGGSEGVLFLANLYHEAGKPVVPLNAQVSPDDTGARRLFRLGLASTQAQQLFRSVDQTPHTWINRINFATRTPVTECIEQIVRLLEDLARPRAFVVRLLNPDIAEFREVEEYFDNVVQPIIESELGYEMLVVDGHQPYEHSRVDQEIFNKLHRSQFVVADITGMRPNCFLELGYALGRGLPTLLMGKEGIEHPFDLTTFAGLHWKPSSPTEERRRDFREHWQAIRNRPPLVSTGPLIS
jgi:hypothetical protein